MRRLDYVSCSDWFLHPDDPIAMLRFENQIPTPDHKHEYVEILVIFSCKETHVTGEISRPLKCADILVIGKRRSHRIIETKN